MLVPFDELSQERSFLCGFNETMLQQLFRRRSLYAMSVNRIIGGTNHPYWRPPDPTLSEDIEKQIP